MPHCRSTILALVLLAALPVLAHAKLECGVPSTCTIPTVIATARTAVEAACPCASSSTRKQYTRCSRSVLKGLARQLGASGFPAVCQRKVKQALATALCARPGAVLCRKATRRGGVSCVVSAAAKCADPFPSGATCGLFPTCAEACDPPVCTTTSTSSTVTTTTSTSTSTTIPLPVLQNADFDLGHVGWAEDSVVFPGGSGLILQQGTSGAPAADSGTWLARLGGANDEVADLYQQVTVPVGVGSFYLNFRYQVSSAETNCDQGTPSDVFRLLVDGIQVDGVAVCSAFNTGANWGELSFVPDLGLYAGSTITLRIRVVTNGTLPSSVYLDSLRFSRTPLG